MIARKRNSPNGSRDPMTSQQEIKEKSAQKKDPESRKGKSTAMATLVRGFPLADLNRGGASDRMLKYKPGRGIKRGIKGPLGTKTIGYSILFQCA